MKILGSINTQKNNCSFFKSFSNFRNKALGNQGQVCNSENESSNLLNTITKTKFENKKLETKVNEDECIKISTDLAKARFFGGNIATDGHFNIRKDPSTGHILFNDGNKIYSANDFCSFESNFLKKIKETLSTNKINGYEIKIEKIIKNIRNRYFADISEDKQEKFKNELVLKVLLKFVGMNFSKEKFLDSNKLISNALESKKRNEIIVTGSEKSYKKDENTPIYNTEFDLCQYKLPEKTKKMLLHLEKYGVSSTGVHGVEQKFSIGYLPSFKLVIHKGLTVNCDKLNETYYFDFYGGMNGVQITKQKYEGDDCPKFAGGRLTKKQNLEIVKQYCSLANVVSNQGKSKLFPERIVNDQEHNCHTLLAKALYNVVPLVGMRVWSLVPYMRNFMYAQI